MKAVVACCIMATGLLGVLAFSELQQGRRLTQQIGDYERQNEQLLKQIENNSLEKLEMAKALESLHSELSSRDSQLSSLTRQLESVQQQIDPDYQQIESRIRQQVVREMQASNNAANADPRLSAFNFLSELDPVVMGEILALNAQFGEFIKDLDVSEEREAAVINALHNLIADQNQARTNLMLEMRGNPEGLNRDELIRQMQALSSPEAQREALSYDLTDSELDAFSEYQEQRRNSTATFGGFSSSSGGTLTAPVFSGGAVIQSGSGQSRAIQIMPLGPDN